MPRGQGTEVYEKLSKLCNGPGADSYQATEFVEGFGSDHRTLQQQAAAVFISCIRELAIQHRKGYTDGRNEYTGKLADLMWAAVEAEDPIVRDHLVRVPLI